MNVINKFQLFYNKILNCFFLISDTLICKTNVVKLIVTIALLVLKF